MGRVDEHNETCKILNEILQVSKPELTDQKCVSLCDMLILIDISKSLAVIADSLNKEGDES